MSSEVRKTARKTLLVGPRANFDDTPQACLNNPPGVPRFNVSQAPESGPAADLPRTRQQARRRRSRLRAPFFTSEYAPAAQSEAQFEAPRGVHTVPRRRPGWRTASPSITSGRCPNSRQTLTQDAPASGNPMPNVAQVRNRESTNQEVEHPTAANSDRPEARHLDLAANDSRPQSNTVQGLVVQPIRRPTCDAVRISPDRFEMSRRQWLIGG